ncbi:MAG: hypothetical protein ACXWR1_13410 [Bdellovibrionota bacterium]
MLRSPSERAQTRLLYAALFSFALIARLLYSGKTLDHDEMATAAWAMSRSPAEVFQKLFYPYEGNTAGYPLFIFLWGKLGLSEQWLRLPSALAGAATVVLFYRRNARRVKPEAALWAALLLAVAAAPLLQSQNARCYSLFGFFAYLALDCFDRGKVTGYVLASIAALSLHHFAWLYLTPLWIFGLARMNWDRQAGRTLAPLLLIWASYLPQVPLLLWELRSGPVWIGPASIHSVVNAMLALIWLHGPLATAMAGALIFFGLCRRFYFQRVELAWACFPILAAALISLFGRHVFAGLYLFPSAFGFFGLLAAGIDGLAGLGLWAARASALLMLVLIRAQLPDFYAAPKTADWRGASEFMLSKQNECSNILLTDPFFVNRWPYYLGSKFEIRSWYQGYPKTPFWVAGAGRPYDPAITDIAKRMGALEWRGAGARADCIRP